MLQKAPNEIFGQLNTSASFSAQSVSHWALLVAQTVKNLPASFNPCVATHSSILTWRIPWTEEPGRLQSMMSQSRTRLSDLTLTFSLCVYHITKWGEKGTFSTASILYLRPSFTPSPLACHGFLSVNFLIMIFFNLLIIPHEI